MIILVAQHLDWDDVAFSAVPYPSLHSAELHTLIQLAANMLPQQYFRWGHGRRPERKSQGCLPPSWKILRDAASESRPVCSVDGPHRDLIDYVPGPWSTEPFPRIR